MLQAGEYKGNIIDASMNESERSPYALVRVQPTGNPETVSWFGSFSETVIGSGPNQGRTVAAMTIEALAKLGWDGNFEKLDSLVGREVVFGVKNEPDRNNSDQMRVKVSYIRLPGSSKPMQPATAKSLSAKFKGEALAAIKTAKAPPAPAKPNGAGSEDFGPTDYGDAGEEAPF